MEVDICVANLNTSQVTLLPFAVWLTLWSSNTQMQYIKIDVVHVYVVAEVFRTRVSFGPVLCFSR